MSGDVRVRRARLEEVQALAREYRDEAVASSADGLPWDAPLPQGGVVWLAEDDDGVLGYAAATLRPSGSTVGPVFTRPAARRRGVGAALLSAIRDWADSTRVPVVEVSVAHDNPEGRAFLESLGYRPRRILMSRRPQAPEPPRSG